MFRTIIDFNNKMLNKIIRLSNKVVGFLFFCLIISFSIKFFAEEMSIHIKNKINVIKIIHITEEKDKAMDFSKIENIKVYFYKKQKTDNLENYDIIINYDNSDRLELLEKELKLLNLFNCPNLNNLKKLKLSNSNTIIYKDNLKIAAMNKSKGKKSICLRLENIISKIEESVY